MRTPFSELFAARMLGSLEKAGTSEGAKRGWETRRGRSPAEETPAEERGPALEERETVEMPGEAHEEVLPGGPTPELEEMVTPEAVGPEPETEALPETPAGEAGAPPAEAPAAEAKPQWRPNTTPWRGRERPGPTHGEDYHPDLPELRQILEGEDMSDALDSGGPLGGIFDDAAAYLNENTEEDAWEMDSPDRIRDLYGGINESAEFGLAAAEALDAAADRLRREGALDDDDYGEVQAALEEARDKLDETRWAADHGRPKPGAKLSPEDVWVKPGVEAMRKLDDVWGRLHTAHEARIGPEGEIMSNKSGAGLGLGLGRFSKFADTREGRVEKAKAALLEKSGGARPGGLFDALLPGDLRQGSRVAAPNPETHRKL